MGTELLAAGIPLGHCLEELCVSQPDLVRGVHERYIAAGARVIETNTFGANAVRLATHGHEHRVNEINWSAAQLAKEVARGTDVHVAGSVGPLGVSAEEANARGIDRHAVFLEQIGALLDGGCRLIFLETFLDVDELLLALDAKHSLHHCPVVALLAIEDPAQIQSAAIKLREADADVVGINCVDGATALSLLSSLEDPGPFAAFPSAGLPEQRAGRLLYPTTATAFAAQGLKIVEQGARLIGGCCGTDASHIAALAKAFETAASGR